MTKNPTTKAHAHVAERINRGEVLNRDVQDVHAGYINFANAMAIRLFGDDLLSLRYPLVVASFVQACLIYLLLIPRGVLIAVVGSMAMTSLSFIQFLNPNRSLV